MIEKPDHGGNLSDAIATYGGDSQSWIDLSTGIAPHPFPLPPISNQDWQTLPDVDAFLGLERAARAFWAVPDGAAILLSAGASALIARLPDMWEKGRVFIPGPTYNEHAVAFDRAGWTACPKGQETVRVIVQPNNPDGYVWSGDDLGQQVTIVDESFCDVMPDQSFVHLTGRPDLVVLKSFGKFWGLGGLRLGCAIGPPDLITRLGHSLGPWQVSGPALRIGQAALRDTGWAQQQRARCAKAADRLDRIITSKGATLIGGTSLFRLYKVDDAREWQTRLARHHIWSRIFPYDPTWLRLGLPPDDGWDRLAQV
jgi:cobalamin biosynthetic protein CobC